MHASQRIRRTSTRIAFALAAVLLTGCLDSTGPDEEHEEPDIAGLTVAAASGSAATGSVTWSPTGQTGTLTLRANTANALTVKVLGLDGLDEPVVQEHADDFEIRLLQGSTVVARSTSAYPYAISVTPTQTGSATYTIQVYALEHGHAEFDRQLVASVVAQ